MRQFGYMQFILRDPSDCSPLVMAFKDADVMYDDFLNHLLSAVARGTIAPSS